MHIFYFRAVSKWDSRLMRLCLLIFFSSLILNVFDSCYRLCFPSETRTFAKALSYKDVLGHGVSMNSKATVTLQMHNKRDSWQVMGSTHT